MGDEEIIALYWQCDEEAIGQTRLKYGSYLSKIAYNILFDREDSEESVNDTYFRAWNSMPPQRPKALPAYLCKLARQAAIDILRKRSSKKRQPSQYMCSLTELEDCLSDGNRTEQDADLHLLAGAIGAFLMTVSGEERSLFLSRYYFADSLRDAAGYLGMSESKAKSMLYRTRIGLRRYLEKEGFFDEA